MPAPLSRRRFIERGAALVGATAAMSVTRAAAQDLPSATPARGTFTLHYAPHPGMFRFHAGNDVIDQIEFAYDQGFTAWEHNALPKETPQLQERIGDALADRNMKMGIFAAYASFDEPTFAAGNKDQREAVLAKVREAVGVAKRVGAKWMAVVPGSVDQQSINDDEWNRYGGARLAPGYQTANVIELLRRCAEILEPQDLVMVIEPLNWYSNHGGVFLRFSDQAYAICKAVDSPACKILFDIYHQQISEGNLIPNIDRCWDEIGYFHCGDNPGRKEPGTGEINYRNVFGHIHQRSKEDQREMLIGMEHGSSLPGKPGELAVIEAYRNVDPK